MTNDYYSLRELMVKLLKGLRHRGVLTGAVWERNAFETAVENIGRDLEVLELAFHGNDAGAAKRVAGSVSSYRKGFSDLGLLNHCESRDHKLISMIDVVSSSGLRLSISGFS